MPTSGGANPKAQGFRDRTHPGVLAALFATLILLGASQVRAAELYAADGIDLRWDNTLRYSEAFRVSPRSTSLISNPNADDGDRNFAQGLISNRLDLMSEFDLSEGNFGIHASAAAWYDTVYHTRTDNDSPASYNVLSVPNTAFAPAVRNLSGQYIDPEDAFVYGNFTVEGTPISFRVGRQTLLWGESLFFDENSIAAAQAPVDYIKSLSAQDAYSNNVFLPVSQLSLTSQPLANISLSFYYQFEWRPDRQPGDGSYFSYNDYIGVGAQRLFSDANRYFVRQGDETPPAGQYGIALHTTLDEWDLGLYALYFNAMEPVTLSILASNPPAAGRIGSYEEVYPSGIRLYGFSFSGYLGDSNVAGEISARQNTPLSTYVPLSAALPSADAYDTVISRGNTLHAQLSSISTFPASALWDSADLNLEADSDGVLTVTGDQLVRVQSDNPFDMSGRALFQPRFFRLLPNLDLALPIGLGYQIAGRNRGYGERQGAGDVEIGISATYLSLWKATLSFTGFLGGPASQPLADRNFVGLSIERTF